MFTYLTQKKENFIFLYGARVLVFILSFSLIFAPSASYAQSVFVANLPVPGTMVPPSPAFVPVLLKGMTIHPDDPLKFDFIIDSGNTEFSEEQIKQESERLVKYFLASMTIPKDDLWVNLSPYEKDRIIPDELGKTELGRDMLAQDYILKQLTASLMYPEKELGKEFWSKVYQKAQEKYGTTEIPVDTFNKVWILPETATVYEHEKTVYIVDTRLRVMLDNDYEAMQYAKKIEDGREKIEEKLSDQHPSSNFNLQSLIIKEIILPEIEREVNEGQNFAPLRQIYHSLILTKWYKETVKNSLLSQVYVDQRKTAGVESGDETLKGQIYAQYMEAYKKGVFNYIKEDYDRLSKEYIPRKYFSGGEQLTQIPLKTTSSPVIGNGLEGKGYKATVINTPHNDNASSPIAIPGTIAWHKKRLRNLELQISEKSMLFLKNHGQEEIFSTDLIDEYKKLDSLFATNISKKENEAILEKLSRIDKILKSSYFREPAISVLRNKISSLTKNNLESKEEFYQIYNYLLTALKHSRQGIGSNYYFLNLEDALRQYYRLIDNLKLISFKNDLDEKWIEELLLFVVDLDTKENFSRVYPNLDFDNMPNLNHASATLFAIAENIEKLRKTTDEDILINAVVNDLKWVIVNPAKYRLGTLDMGSGDQSSSPVTVKSLILSAMSPLLMLSALQEPSMAKVTEPPASIVISEDIKALIEAASAGNLERVRALLRQPVDVDGKYADMTALMAAAFNGHIEIVEALLQKGARVDTKESNGITALMVATVGGHAEIVQTLIQNGADVNTQDNVYGQTALMWAAGNGYAQIAHVLMDAGADANIASNNGETALMFAAGEGHIEIVEALLEDNADVHIKGHNGGTALIWAVEGGHAEAVDALLEKGADANIQINNGLTALMIAAADNHAEIVQALLKRGADTRVKARNGWTALDFAKQEGNKDIIKILLDATSKKNGSSSPLDNNPDQSPAVSDRKVASDELGGIDMNDIGVERQGAGVDIQFDPAELQEIIDAGIEGFAPVIINIIPLPSVLPLLGLEPKREEDAAEELSRLN